MTIDDVRARLAFVSQYEHTMVYGPDLRALLDEHAAARAALRDILAVIHRDGGDHYAKVGAEQAVRDAHVVWADLVRERDEARAERYHLAAALADPVAGHTTTAAAGDDLTWWWTPERRAAAKMREERDTLRADVARLTRERDEARADRDRAESSEPGLSEMRAERDRLAAALAEVERQWTYGLTRLDRAESALAEVREAAAEVVRQQLGDDLTWWTPERRAAAHDARVSLAALRLADALASTPADLAAARDARVRAEALRDAADAMEDRARTAEGAAMQSDGGEYDERFWRNIGRHRRQEAAWLRAEAERIGRGGR